MTEQVVAGLFCPSCAAGVPFDGARMMQNNGWVIDYDMEAARVLARNGMQERLSPGFLFDEGYCTWNGIYPGDHIDSVRERDAIVSIARTDPREYLNRLKFWANDRMARLRDEGWRKAQDTV
jgi:hypothetical protein